MFRFGYCGAGAGYCEPVDGCVLQGMDIIGGDMEEEEGGGGVNVEKGDLDGCAFRCEEKIRCGWYSYDKGSNLCYLKFARGYFRNVTGTKDIISGSTQSGGCVLEAPCKAPYTKVGDRCVNYAEVSTCLVIAEKLSFVFRTCLSGAWRKAITGAGSFKQRICVRITVEKYLTASKILSPAKILVMNGTG